MLTMAFGEATGYPSISKTDENINVVPKKIILANRRITIREVTKDLNLSIGYKNSNIGFFKPCSVLGFNLT